MGWLLPVGATLAGVFSVAYSMRFIHDVFFNGEPVGLPKTPHEPPRFMRVPVELLVLCLPGRRTRPGTDGRPDSRAAGRGRRWARRFPRYSLADLAWLQPAARDELVALGGGVALYFGLQRFINLHRIVQLPRGGREAFAFVADGAGDRRRAT